MVLSSGSVEMSLLSKTDKGWAQMFMEEGSRAELHFINVTQETFPLGLAFDLTSRKQFPVKGSSIDIYLHTLFCFAFVFRPSGA